MDKSKTGYSSHVFLEGKDPTLSSQLTQGLEYNALKNDQVLGLLQVGLRLRGQAHYSLGGLYPSSNTSNPDGASLKASETVTATEAVFPPHVPAQPRSTHFFCTAGIDINPS